MKLAVLCLSSVSALLVLLTAPAPGRELDPPDSATVTDGSTAFPGHYEEPDDPAAQYAHHEAPSDAPAPGPAVLEGQISSPALVWIRDGYESIQVNVNAQGNNIVGDAANEPSIAIDPTNPSRMAIGWRQFDTIRSDFRQSGGSYSHDGGQTWTFPGVLEP